MNNANNKNEWRSSGDSENKGEQIEEIAPVGNELTLSEILLPDISSIDWNTFEITEDFTKICNELELDAIGTSWFGEMTSNIPLNKEIKKKKRKAENLTLYDNPQGLMRIIPKKTRKLSNVGRFRGSDCMEAGCIQRPTYNYEGNTVPIWCRKHALVNMINVLKFEQYESEMQPRPIAPRVIKSCDHGNGVSCKRPAYYGNPLMGLYYCEVHKHFNDVMDPDDIHPCGKSGCNKPAVYSFTGHCKLYCRKHKGVDMKLFKPKSR